MAPRRGGSGSSSSSSTSSCPDAFQETVERASFANDVIFFAVTLGITIALCMCRKKSVAGKGLLGLPLIGCLFFFLLTYACSIISTVLVQCGTTSYHSYFSWQVSIVIFTYISYWLFLVVVVFNLNSMLRRHLDIGYSNIVFKIVPLVIIGVMGLLSGAVAGLSAYFNYTQTTVGGFTRYSNVYDLLQPLERLRAAYYALYLVSVLASSALALMTIFSLRKAGKAGGDLLGWVLALTVAMAFWTILTIVFAAWSLDDEATYTWESSVALSYFINFGQTLSFIVILCIAKHVSWGKSTGAEPMGYHSQYAPVANSTGQPYQPVQPYGYNADTTGQAYQYHQAPEFVSTNIPARA